MRALRLLRRRWIAPPWVYNKLLRPNSTNMHDVLAAHLLRPGISLAVIHHLSERGNAALLVHGAVGAANKQSRPDRQVDHVLCVPNRDRLGDRLSLRW